MQRRHAFLIALFLAASLPACANEDSGDINALKRQSDGFRVTIAGAG